MDDSADVSGEHSGQSPGEQSPEGQWLTYDELSRVRGIGRESAVKLVQRKRWRRIPGNDGVARILVPPDWLMPAKEEASQPAPERSPGPSPDVPSSISVLQAAFKTALAAKDSEIIALQAAIKAKEGEIAAVRDMTDGLRQERDNERARADRAEAGREGERARADDLRQQIDVLNAEMVVIRAEADRALAEERLRADQLCEQVDAGHRDLDAVRADADARRTTIDELKAGQALMTDMHARELAAAQDRLERVRDSAEAIRQAEAARKARGRLRRAWDGWRGL